MTLIFLIYRKVIMNDDRQLILQALGMSIESIGVMLARPDISSKEIETLASLLRRYSVAVLQVAELADIEDEIEEAETFFATAYTYLLETYPDEK